MDFVQTKKWNRTNPWWNVLYPPHMKEFVYPLTCCPVGNHQQNWKIIPQDQLEKAANCALNGINIYETVIDFNNKKSFNKIFFSIGLL